ncbi:MAG TPA: ImmA/IrrE family metallo-endopeptidase, partial [Rhizomicrobium sp.]|nr:ImmA/IrrE family metallo-endopeptidase [Rhizomicrobium sp.]
VRRMTIAHELGHLLWDPDPQLQKLRVDEYNELEANPTELVDFVEARANAFAVQFLAPQNVVRDLYQTEANSDGVRKIMELFGVSFTTAKYQIWNALDRAIPLESIKTKNVAPTEDWQAEESYTLDFFKPSSVSETRRGYFAGLVAWAERCKFLSSDSAAAYLDCPENEYVKYANMIRELYPLLGENSRKAKPE